VIFGREQEGFSDLFDVGSLNGANGFKVEATGPSQEFGKSVSTTGNFQDGISGLVIGAHYAYDQTGIAYILSGRSNWSPLFNLTTLDGITGFSVKGLTVGSHLGHRVSVVDINADSISDLILAAPSPHVPATLGVIYFIYGNRYGNYSDSFDLLKINGTNGFSIPSKESGEFNWLGYGLDSAGDINGDGPKDLVIGAPVLGSGAVYVLFGQSSGFPHPFDLSTLNGSNGFTMSGRGRGNSSNFGWCAGTAGDINADGISDLIVGAYGENSNTGEAYILFGKNKNTHYPPILRNPFTEQTVFVNKSFSFNLTDTFDPLGDKLTYTATVSDGDPLPNWVSFNPSVPSFSGTANTAGSNLWNLIAMNTYNQSAVANISLKVIDPPKVDIPKPPSGPTMNATLGVIIGASVGGAVGFALLLGLIIFLIFRGTFAKGKEPPSTIVTITDTPVAETVEPTGI
jgi:hypothetical protein